MDTEGVRIILAHLVALRGNLDELLADGISSWSSDKKAVRGVTASAVLLFRQLESVAPEYFGSNANRIPSHWPLINNKKVALSLRSDITYVLQVGAQLGLCAPDTITTFSPPKRRGRLTRSIQKVAIGVAIVVIAALIVHLLHL